MLHGTRNGAVLLLAELNQTVHHLLCLGALLIGGESHIKVHLNVVQAHRAVFGLLQRRGEHLEHLGGGAAGGARVHVYGGAAGNCGEQQLDGGQQALAHTEVEGCAVGTVGTVAQAVDALDLGLAVVVEFAAFLLARVHLLLLFCSLLGVVLHAVVLFSVVLFSH